MAKYWMITNRNVESDGFGPNLAPRTYRTSEGGPLDKFKSWKKVTDKQFQLELLKAAEAFPLILDPERHEDQKHVSIFVHGYNDLFKSGEETDKSDGDAIANLTYRVTALFTGRDNVLGMSAGLKHFGKRRLGRSGLDREYPIPDNVWDVDCTTLISQEADNIHSVYFDEPKTLKLMRQILRGADRKVLAMKKFAPQ